VAETEEQRSKRHQRRTLFDGVADLYAASRPGYPGEIIEFLTATAGVGQGSSVLEVGCGTGQLTNGLAHYGFDLTAIDIGPALVAAAQDRLAEASISFQVCSFEDFAAADASFDLIISATAFHWVDPEVKFSKSAQLLRPSGWLALLSTERLYDDRLAAALRQMWIARSEDWARNAWSTMKPQADADATAIADSGLFGQLVHRTHESRATVPADTVLGVENTRASSLSWPADARQAFTEELRSHLGSLAQVPVTEQTFLTMARIR
jgi:2-polyprenyl-3-methyl-5-hydroxy-6-metoxy-1,4-benzoquinol methylase